MEALRLVIPPDLMARGGVRKDTEHVHESNVVAHLHRTSVYLLDKNRLWVKAALATAVVAAVCYWLSRPIPGLGIAEPVFVPSVTTAIVALLLSREQAAPLAYIGGSLGTLIGADLLNLGNIRGLGAPVASIGGAGTFDGIFLIGIVAVLIASLSQSWSRR